MSQKLTLARYLEGRGSVKSLTHIEAEAFGVPYPLVSGWPARHGDMEITQAMIGDLARRIAGARRSTAAKALRGMCGVGTPAPNAGLRSDTAAPSPPTIASQVAHVEFAPSFPGFVLRPARKARSKAILPG